MRKADLRMSHDVRPASAVLLLQLLLLGTIPPAAPSSNISPVLRLRMHMSYTLFAKAQLLFGSCWAAFS
jgi:hypothetical protein